MTTCFYCGGERHFEVLDLYVDERAFTFDACCEGAYEEALEEFRHGDPRECGRWLEEETGVSCRRVVSDDDAGLRYGNGGLVLDFGLELVPVTLAQAKGFIHEHHRHNDEPQGWLFGFGLRNGSEMVAVATVGRPVARMLDNGTVVEVTRVCVSPEMPAFLVWNACSKLYGAAAREAKGRGYARIITYTRAGEAATSIRACGWIPTHVSRSALACNRFGCPSAQPRRGDDASVLGRESLLDPAWRVQPHEGLEG